jgi:hypothetical protein
VTNTLAYYNTELITIKIVAHAKEEIEKNLFSKKKKLF